jgi:anti-sigma regulatory factor (Ser/Thr protein kinase)
MSKLQECTAPRLTPSEAGSYFELEALPSAPFRARQQTRIVLSSWQVSADMIEIAELLVSELITNAVKFGRPEPTSGLPAFEMPERAHPISLTMKYQPGRVMIEVGDHGPGSPAFSEARDDAVSGRGLMLVQALSKEWGHYLPSSGGKIVYCVLAIA